MKCLALLSLLVFAACDGETSTLAPCADLGGACLTRPESETTRTPCGAFDTFCDSSNVTTPQLACLGAAPTASTTKTKVDVQGFVRVFATGPDTDGLAVQAFVASNLESGTDPVDLTPLARSTTALYLGNPPCPTAPDPSMCPAADLTTFRVCDVDSTQGCTISSAACGAACADGLDGRHDEGLYCRATSAGDGVCVDRRRHEAAYALTHLPVDTQLAIRVTGADGVSNSVWATTVAFDVVISSTAPTCATATSVECFDGSGVYHLDVTALSQVDYVALPQHAGEGGISQGLGAVLGQVHDCDGVRLANVQVGFPTSTGTGADKVLLPSPDRLTYFQTHDVLVPVPDVTRAQLGTDASGLYGAFDLQPGAFTVQTAGFIGASGALQSMGTTAARVYPDTVTLIGIDGGRPRSTVPTDAGEF